jgi:acyl dehydratase
MGMNRALIGKTYEPVVWQVTADQIRRYADAYNDDNPAFHDETRPGGLVAPPLFNVVTPAPCLAMVFFDADLNVNFGRLVHGEQDMTFPAPIRPGDTITSRSRIDDIVEKSSGELLIVGVESRNAGGAVVCDQKFIFFVRGDRKAEGGKKESAPEPERGTPIVAHTSRVDLDQTPRYAEISGDHNPIHLDDDFAKAVGLPGRINHGLCTMAMASKAVIDGCLGGDPTRLRRLRLRFSKPVLPGQEIVTRIWAAGESGALARFTFETTNEAGVPVLTDGVAETTR